jgi:hypothetical protein
VVKKTKTWCPVCDEGWVVPIRVKALDLNGLYCEECSAFWPQFDGPSPKAFLQFEPFVRSFGVSGGPSDVEFLPIDDEEGEPKQDPLPAK